MSLYRDFTMPQECQFTEILLRFYGAPSMSIYRDFMVPRECQFTEILWCHEYVNLYVPSTANCETVENADPASDFSSLIQGTKDAVFRLRSFPCFALRILTAHNLWRH